METIAVVTFWGVTGDLVEVRFRVFLSGMESAVLTYVERLSRSELTAFAAPRVWDETDIVAVVAAKPHRHVPLTRVVDRLSDEGIALLCGEPTPIELSEAERAAWLPKYRPELVAVQPTAEEIEAAKVSRLEALREEVAQLEAEMAAKNPKGAKGAKGG